MLESILQDLRFALRSPRHAPGVTLTVLVTLMLGIGANTILFSVVYEVLLRPLPYPDPGNLVWVGESGNSKRVGYDLVLTSDIADWRAQSHSLIGVVAVFERKPLSYALINGGYMTVALVLMGAIIGLWR